MDTRETETTERSAWDRGNDVDAPKTSAIPTHATQPDLREIDHWRPTQRSRCYLGRMSKELWTTVDDYLQGLLLRHDGGLDAVLAANRAAGLPAIDVAPNQGKFLYLLARLLGARNILEIGTLGGYSTIWLARALPPDGHLITLEADPKHAEVARENLARAQLGQVAEVRVGRALDTLPSLAGQVFDLVFIDADKPNNAAYLGWALQLTRLGSAIVVDNVVREGGVLDAASTDPRIQGTRSLLEVIAQEPRLEATAIQTVGCKGHDGFVLARVRSPRAGERQL